MGITHQVAAAVGDALEGARAGDEKLLSRKIAAAMKAEITVTSPAFSDGSRLPVSGTVDGDGSPPALAWTHLPSGTRSVLLVCEDPDAPFPDPFVHWMVYGIPASVRSVDARTSGQFAQGKNTKLGTGFTPAAPPPGHGVHHYHFQVFALDCASDFEPDDGRGAIIDLVQGHVLAWGELVGTYERT